MNAHDAPRGRVRIQVSYYCGPATYRAGWACTVPVPEATGHEWAEWYFHRIRALASRWMMTARTNGKFPV